MISELTGELKRVEADRVFVSAGALVFEVLVPAFEIEALRALIGKELTLVTIFDLEGDATRGGLSPRLIGFTSATDRRFFQVFTTVKGIGPKRALRTLAVAPAQIAAAIESRDTRFLSGLPEIGKRLSDQIVAELAGKMKDFAAGEVVTTPGPAGAARSTRERDAIDAAVALGYSRPEAERALDRAMREVPPAELAKAEANDLLRHMLRAK
jgi:Holliday junction DNA helicase RuvA